MSGSEVKIPIEPFKFGNKTYTYVKVRAPGYYDYMDLGEAISVQQTESGAMTIEHLERLKAYADRLVTTGDDEIAEPAVLAAGGFRLARKVHKAVADFLYSPPDETGTTSQTS